MRRKGGDGVVRAGHGAGGDQAAAHAVGRAAAGRPLCAPRPSAASVKEGIRSGGMVTLEAKRSFHWGSGRESSRISLKNLDGCPPLSGDGQSEISDVDLFVSLRLGGSPESYGAKSADGCFVARSLAACTFT